MKQPSLKTLRNKADSLLTPLVIRLSPRCLLCGRQSQVAHHFVHKSKSSRLRYELDNLISLCNSCHFALHNNESLYAARIVKLKGLKWFSKLEKLKNEIVKVDRFFYEKYTQKLKELQG